MLASSPSSIDSLNRTTTGRAELLSSVPTSLTNSLHYTLFTNLSSVFLSFENITQNILEEECGSLPEDDGSNNFECWHRLSSSTDDVDYLGIDFQAVLYNNQDLPPPNMTFVNNFNTSVDSLKDSTTAAIGFIENDIPDNLKVNTDHCNLPLEQLLLPPPVVPITTTTAATTTTTTTAAAAAAITTTTTTTTAATTTTTPATTTTTTTTPATTTITPMPSTESSENGSGQLQTGINATLLFFSTILLLILIH